MKCTIVFQQNWENIHAVDESGKRLFRYIINEGSSRSSKTISLIQCFDLYARTQENKRLTVWRDTKTDCKKTVLNDMIKTLKRESLYKVGNDFNKTESIFTYATGSTVEIHGTDDEETVHGLTQDGAWLNEPYKISHETFNQIDQRTADFIFIDYNPKKDHWVEDLKKDSRAIVIKSTFKDNPFCPEESKRKILSYQPVCASDIVLNKLIQENEVRQYDFEKNPLQFSKRQINEVLRCIDNEYKNSASLFNWQVYGLGEKSEKPNRIFNWQSIPDHEYQQINAPIYIGNDWGKVDPWAIAEVKYQDGCLYVHELNYLSENKIRETLKDQERILLSKETQDENALEEGLVKWYFERLGISKKNVIICDSNRPLKIASLRRIGYDYAEPASKPGGSILHGIDLMENLKIYFTASSKNIAYEQENYSRKVDRYGTILEEPQDLDNHLIDCIRYVVLYLQRNGTIKLS